MYGLCEQIVICRNYFFLLRTLQLCGGENAVEVEFYPYVVVVNPNVFLFSFSFSFCFVLIYHIIYTAQNKNKKIMQSLNANPHPFGKIPLLLQKKENDVWHHHVFPCPLVLFLIYIYIYT